MAHLSKREFVDIIIKDDDIPTMSRSMTFGSFLISIFCSIGVFSICIIIFSVLRKRMRSVYEPRTFIRANDSRSPSTSDGLLSWLMPVWEIKIADTLHSSGLDAYFFLRYILIVISICCVTFVPLASVLIPIHLSGKREKITGLDRLSAVSIADDQKAFHVAHLFLCILCTLGSLMYFKKELNNYFKVRAHHILSQEDTPGSASTLLIKGLSPQFQNETSIKLLFEGHSNRNSRDDVVPLIRKIWFNKDYSKLHALVKKRKKIVNKLEELELWLIKRSLGVTECPENQVRCNENKDSLIIGNRWREYLSSDDLTEMHGSRGSTLLWLKSELNKLNSQIYQMQSRDDIFPSANSCFVQFNNKLSSFIASRLLFAEMSLNSPSLIFDRVYPADIIWSNMSSRTWPGSLLNLLATFLNYLFIFGWAAPAAVISMMTQTEVIMKWMPQVDWIANSPQMVRLMSNFLSPILVSCLTSQVPTVFRFLARLKGFPTNTRVEMDVQKYLFLFMFFQLFLIVTLASGLPGLIVKTLLNTGEGAITLANSLPRATTFFISYLMASCMTSAGNSLLQSWQLVTSLWMSMRAKTPRQKFAVECRYSTIYWGSVFPLATNVGAIAIAYSLISPLILVSAIGGLISLFVAYKYRILYCYVPRCVADGDYYPKALFQLFSGFYCQQISLLGTFLVSSQLDLAVIVSILIVITIVAQHRLQCQFHDLSTRIPLYILSENKGKAVYEEQSDLNKIEKGAIKIPPAGTHEQMKAPSPLFDVPLNASNASSPLGSPVSQRTLNDAGQTPTPSGEDYDPRMRSWPEVGSSPRRYLSSPIIQGEASATLQETWMGLFDALAFDFRSLSIGQQLHITGQLFYHPDRRIQRPCVWLPKDWKGVAQDQVTEMQSAFTDLRSSCSGSIINANGDITMLQAPPDFDPLELMKL